MRKRGLVALVKEGLPSLIKRIRKPKKRVVRIEKARVLTPRIERIIRKVNPRIKKIELDFVKQNPIQLDFIEKGNTIIKKSKVKKVMFKKLFKRKAGGTFLGNLVRGVASQYSGGILGSGMMKLKAGESVSSANKRAEQEIQTKLTGAIVGGGVKSGLAAGLPVDSSAGGSKVSEYLGLAKQYWYVPAAVVVGAAYYFYSKKGGL